MDNKDGKYFVDLRGILEKQARYMEVSNIELHPDCTYCKADDYFSYRRDKPQHVQAMLAWIVNSM
jgi:copper oxidase (laccase) domain-containing protein